MTTANAKISAESRISSADVSSRILRIPAAVRNELSEDTTQLTVSVAGEDGSEDLTVSARRTFLGGVTDLFRRVSLLRSGDDGNESRDAEVAWEVDLGAGSALLTIRPDGEWTPVRKRKGSSTVAEGILTSGQEDYLRAQAETFMAEPAWAREMEARAETSRLFREEVEASGILKGEALTQARLARFVELAWKIENLNGMSIPQLVGTYTYYCHFKGFAGTTEEFSAHMARKRKNWEEGSVGYPGADPVEVGVALARLLTADDEQLGLALHEFLRFQGAGRGLTSGLMLLWDPTRHAMVNGAAVGPFKATGGPLALTRQGRAELRDLARSRFGIPEGADYTDVARFLGWVQLFDMVREICDFEHFFEVDWILWRMTTTAKGERQPRSPTRGGASSAKDGDTQYMATPEDLVEAAMAESPEQRLQVRESAAIEARALLDKNPGHLSEEELREVLRLFNVDFFNGKVRADRFSPGFVGATANKLADALDAVNEWIARVWNAEGDAVYGLLTQAWESKAFPSARSMLSMVLHVKDPTTFNPVMGGLARGYRAVTGKWPHRNGEQYRAYNEYVASLREAHGLSPYVVDVLFALASKQAKKGKAKRKVGTLAPKGEFGGFSRDAFTFLTDLAANNNDEWFSEHKKEFQAKVREPLRDLVTVLGERFVDPVDSDLERKPTSPQTLASIRKNAFGSTTNVYWPHYWAAFHRRELKKTEDFQLYLLIHGDYFGFGFASSSATKADLALLTKRLRTLPALAERAFADALGGGCFVRRDDDTREVLEVKTVAALADALDEGPLTVCRELTPDEAAEKGPELAAEVEGVFRALYPLFALATSNEPESVLAAYLDDPIEEPGPEEPTYTVEQLIHETLMDQEDVDELIELLEDKGQAVLYGPPGTGKTWLAERFAKFFTNGGETKTVQFHPSYGYEDFIEGIRPRIDRETRQPVYVVEPGVFRRFCDMARRRKDQRFVLVVDEINRGNLPRIFGELLYLLERRGEQVELPVSGKAFSVPENVYLLGTMNTADHSIALVDVALRRRFHFKALRPDVSLLRTWLKREVPDMVVAADLLQQLNDELEKEGIDENLRIGHSHFMHPALDESVLERVWKHSIVPTLEEYFYGKPKKLDRFTWERFVDADIFESAEAASEDDGDDDDGDAD